MGATQKRTILITGCSAGGAGHALALEFAGRGFRVFATARSTSSLTGLEDKGVEILPLDVTKADSIAALRDEITKRTGGKLDMLYNNAGTMYQIPAIEADPVAVRQMYNTNVFGLFDMVTAFTPLLLASVKDSQLPPTIVNVASVLARLPMVFGAAYNGSKAAVAQYSDTLRLELAPLGIKVVTLYMGEVSTGLMQADNIKFNPDSIYINFESQAKDANSKHARETMKPEDFARKVVSQVAVKKPGSGAGESLWLGTNAWVLWFINAFGPRKMLDSVAEGLVQFNDKSLRQTLFVKGQQSNTPA